MRKTQPVQVVTLVLLLMLIIFGISRNRGAPTQKVQDIDVNSRQAELVDAATQGYQQGVQQTAKQFTEALTQPQAQAVQTQPEDPEVVDITSQLRQNGISLAQWQREDCLIHDGKYGLGDIVPLGDNRYLWIAYSAEEFKKDGSGCAYSILIASSRPELGPLDCVFAHKDRLHKPEHFTIDGVLYNPAVTVIEVYAVLRHGTLHQPSGYFCVNGDIQILKG